MYSDAVDPALRELFGFGAPLPPPEENPDVDLSWWLPARAWATAISARASTAGRRRATTCRSICRWCATCSPRRRDQTLAKEPLDAKFHTLYGWMVLATAWKESCWRQFVRVGDRLQPMRSPVGARRHHAGQSARVARLLRREGLEPGHRLQRHRPARRSSSTICATTPSRRASTPSPATVDNLARATYAAYNGGPGHLTRYRTRKGNRSLRKIDDSFWDKYRKIKSGQTLAVQECF